MNTYKIIEYIKNDEKRHYHLLVEFDLPDEVDPKKKKRVRFDAANLPTKFDSRGTPTDKESLDGYMDSWVKAYRRGREAVNTSVG